jgi:hypothetical protein
MGLRIIARAKRQGNLAFSKGRSPLYPKFDSGPESAAGLPNKSSSALDAARKPYYCGSRYSHISAVLPRRPCLALHRRSARASAANNRESISTYIDDDPVLPTVI